MKRHASFYLGLALLAFVVSGCREGYLSEKAFYQANKLLSGVTPAQFEADPDGSLAKPIEAFEQVAEQFPLTKKAVESLFKVSELRTKQKNYPEARRALAKVIQNFTGRKGWAGE